MTIRATEGLRNDGGIIALDSSATLQVGEIYAQTDTATLMIALAGTQPGVTHGLFNVSQAARLGGTLEIILANDFQPALGNTFDIIKWGSHAGAFGSAVGSKLDSGLTLKPEYQATQLRLTTVAP